MKKNNKRALYESIMRKVSKEVKKALNEEYNALEDIIYEMEHYFNPKMCRNIWETGKVSREFQADDDIYCKYPEDYRYKTEYSQWKSSINMIREAISIVFKYYPGDIDNDVKTAAKLLRVLEVSDNISDLQSKYSVKINNKNISLFNNVSNKYLSHVETLLQIPFIRRVTNFMFWVAKIELLTYGSGQYFYNMLRELSVVLRSAYKDNKDLRKETLTKGLMLPSIIMHKNLDNIITNPSMIKEARNFDDEWDNLDDEAYDNLEPIDDYDDYDEWEWDDTPDIDDLY